MQSVPNLVVGAGLAGSTTAWILARQGYDGLVLEKSDDPCGANGSFRDREGNLFDYGRHVLDANRSDFTANFFRVSQENRVRRFPVRRGIVVDGHLIPYAVPPEQWPRDLRDRLDIDPSAPSVRPGSSREAFADAYGEAFANLVFEDMIAAIPVLQWLKDHGTPEDELLRWIYPWFFPVTSLEAEPDPRREKGVWSPESRRYHHRVRHEDQPEEALYPTDNGYANWIRSLLSTATQRIDLRTGRSDITFDFNPNEGILQAVHTETGSYNPDRVFWCAPAPVLARQLDMDRPAGQPQVGVLGSFTFEEPIHTNYHEILFADPDHPIKRMSVRKYLEGASRSRTLQVEFLYPKGDYDLTPEEWERRWLHSLRELELVSSENTLLNMDFKRVPRGVIPTDEVREWVESVRNTVRAFDATNLVLPRLEAGPGNNSRSIPAIFENVYHALLSD